MAIAALRKLRRHAATGLRVTRVGPFTRERDFTVRQLRPGVWAWSLDDDPSVRGIVSGPRTKREARDEVRSSNREILYNWG